MTSSRLAPLSLVLPLLLASCQDSSTALEEPQLRRVDELPGITTPSQTIPVDQGSVGVVIDTRRIVKKGYEPAAAHIDLAGEFSAYSTELTVDPHTHVAVLSIPASDLTDGELRRLNIGVDAVIRIFDDASQELAMYDDIVRVNASNNPLAMDTGLPAIHSQVTVTEDVPYLIQAITDDPDTNNKTFHLVEVRPTRHDPYGRVTLDDFTGSAENLFYFEAFDSTSLYVKMRLPSVSAPVYLKHASYLQSVLPQHLGTYWETEPPTQWIPWVRLTRADDGLIEISPDTRHPTSRLPPFQYLVTSDGGVLTHGGSTFAPRDTLLVRIVAANIRWEVEDIGTDFTPPIVPPARLDFAFKDIFLNCAPTTSRTIAGVSETQTRSYTVGTEESLELFSSHEASVSVTAGAEAGFNLFGAGATASVETTTGYTYTTSSTTRSTNTWQGTVEETVEVSRRREIEIPPFTAVEVYDAMQSVENVRMPFVQTLRVRGSYEGGGALSGQEITSQLLANQFGGVVSNVGGNFVDITTKGTVIIHKFFEVQTKVTDISDACDN